MNNNPQIIPEGYKSTPVGIIPEDWKVKKLGEVCEVKSGATPSTEVEDYWGGDINWFTPSELSKKYVCESLRKISQEGFKNSSVKLLPKNTILLTTRASIGTASISNVECTTNQGIQSLICKENTIVNYMYEIIAFNKNELLKRANGSTFLEVSNKDLKKILLPIPPQAEQEAIADCLSTWDSGLEKLSALIEAKKEQKKGLMQQLFADQEDWDIKKLGDMCSYKNGGALEETIEEHGRYNLITLNSIDITGKLKPIHHKTNYNDDSLQKEDIIMILSDVAHGNFLGISEIIPDDSFVLNQRVGRLRVENNSCNNYFLKTWINFNQKYFKKMGQGSSQKNLLKKDILDFEIRIPPLSTQEHIAQVLSTADKEIGILEKKYDAMQSQKKGLMQLLLTGKKRLLDQ